MYLVIVRFSLFLLFLAFACNRGPKAVELDLAVLSDETSRNHPRYDKSELYLPAETLFVLHFANRESGSAERFPHNFVLVQPGSAQDPKPADILAEGPPVPSGKSAIVRFQVPPPGHYEFLCTGQGHAHAKPMRGKFVVQ